MKGHSDMTTSFLGRIACAATAIGLFWPLNVRADEIADKGRAILEKNRKAVVTIQLVIKQKFGFMGGGSEGNETKSEVPGTVIDPNGLTVVSLMSTDPGSMFEDMMEGFSPVDSDMDFNFDMSSEVVSVKMLPEGGKEIPAAIVLRDKDLDLAFVRPLAKPTEPMAAISLTDGAKPEILDMVIGISRLGKVGGRASMITPGRIQAIVEKPRTFYVSSGSSMGTPAFALDGKLIGIEVMRMMKTGGSPMGMGMMAGDGMLPVIVPASDVAEVAAQAPEKAEEPKPEAEKVEKSTFVRKKNPEGSDEEAKDKPSDEK